MREGRGVKFIIILAIVSLLLPNFSVAEDARDALLNMTDDISGKREEIDAINKKIKEYENIVAQKQREKLSLENQVVITNSRIEKAKLDIQATELKISETALEIEAFDLQVKDKENKIEGEKNLLSELVRRVRKEEQKSFFAVLFLYDSFSGFFNYLNQLEELNGGLVKTLGSVQKLKQAIELEKNESENKQQALSELRNNLEGKKLSLEEQKQSKILLKVKAASSEEKFRNLVQELKEEQEKVDNELKNLEATLRKKIEEMDKTFLGDGEQLILSWPVEPTRGISTYFFDKDYPYRYLFEHPAIDIRAYQRTPVRAAAPGYVAQTFLKGTAYSYVMIIHRNGISTVYGHLSAISVKNGSYIERGEVIGYSGGMPGTPGAGRLSSGPHLHFEVRLNGIPVDPLDYLFKY